MPGYRVYGNAQGRWQLDDVNNTVSFFSFQSGDLGTSQLQTNLFQVSDITDVTDVGLGLVTISTPGQSYLIYPDGTVAPTRTVLPGYRVYGDATGRWTLDDVNNTVSFSHPNGQTSGTFEL